MIEENVIRTMVELSSTEDEADGIVIEFTPHRTSSQKRDYLIDLFKDRKLNILGRYDSEDGDSDLTDYQALLTAIISLKWQ